MSAAGKPEMTTFAETLAGCAVGSHNRQVLREAHARDLAAAFRRGQEEMREALCGGLDEIMDRYGYIQDVRIAILDAIRALSLREPR